MPSALGYMYIKEYEKGSAIPKISEIAEEAESIKLIYDVFHQLLNQNQNGVKISREEVLKYDVSEIQ